MNRRLEAARLQAVLILMATLWLLCTTAIKPTGGRRKSSQHGGAPNSHNEITKDKKKPTNIITLAESINRSQKSLQDPERARASREQWQKALQEIKDLAPDFSSSKVSKKATALGSRTNKETSSTTGGVFSEWKLSLDLPTRVEFDPETNLTTAEVESDTTELITNKPTSTTRNKASQIPRFEGFNSWERMMQDWADDIKEYMDKIEAENTEYNLSTRGTSSSSTSTTKDATIPERRSQELPVEGPLKDKQIKQHHHSTTSATKDETAPSMTSKRSITLPVPTAAKEGEPVLPETDLSDKSKQVWIVTTAALPWMTGTAVNPLLRAAYMTDGRAEAGGSVTLMLPWLERRQDQEQVYGAGKMFETPAQQEEFIRSWLRDKAKLVSASEKLNIEWYAAWQNKAENSLYSMGDITALIPADKVDICILEEPEHLNW